jgi:hypothetical protein
MRGGILHPDQFAPACDAALTLGQIVFWCGFALVPDVVIAERAANGDVISSTWRLSRHDGRSVHVYREAPR